MKILAFSDLHGQAKALDLLLEKESKNKYDAIIIAGDIGGYNRPCLKTKEVLSSLNIFNCPIFFVLGNSDPEEKEKDVEWPTNCFLLNNKPLIINKYALVGITGVYDIGRDYSNHLHFLESDLNQIHENIKKQGQSLKYIFVTHERIPKINTYFPEGIPFIYLFGHHHRPAHTVHKNINFINCSSLDSRTRWFAGNYWKIELENNQIISTPIAIELPKANGVNFDRRKAKSEVQMFNLLFPELQFEPQKEGPIIFPSEKNENITTG